jgi:hypothetical protein
VNWLEQTDPESDLATTLKQQIEQAKASLARAVGTAAQRDEAQAQAVITRAESGDVAGFNELLVLAATDPTLHAALESLRGGEPELQGAISVLLTSE